MRLRGLGRLHGLRVVVSASLEARRAYWRQKKAAQYARKRAANPNARGRGEMQRSRTHCPHGHEYSPENTYAYAPNKKRPYVLRTCKTCVRARAGAVARAKADKREGHIAP